MVTRCAFPFGGRIRDDASTHHDLTFVHECRSIAAGDTPKNMDAGATAHRTDRSLARPFRERLVLRLVSQRALLRHVVWLSWLCHAQRYQRIVLGSTSPAAYWTSMGVPTVHSTKFKFSVAWWGASGISWVRQIKAAVPCASQGHVHIHDVSGPEACRGAALRPLVHPFRQARSAGP